VMNSVVSVYYYLRVTVAMYMQDASATQQGETQALIFSPGLAVAVFISAYGVLSLGLFPAAYIGIVKQSFLILH